MASSYNHIPLLMLAGYGGDKDKGRRARLSGVAGLVPGSRTEDRWHAWDVPRLIGRRFTPSPVYQVRYLPRFYRVGVIVRIVHAWLAFDRPRRLPRDQESAEYTHFGRITAIVGELM